MGRHCIALFIAKKVSPVAMSIGKTLVTVILAAHLLSCFWFWVHCYDALEQVMAILADHHCDMSKKIMFSIKCVF